MSQDRAWRVPAQCSHEVTVADYLGDVSRLAGLGLPVSPGISAPGVE